MDDWDYTRWDWPEEWVMIKGYPPIKIDKNAPQMANITCRFCGRVFDGRGSKMKHETTSRKTNNICHWNAGINEEQKRMVKFVPPKDIDDKQKIANWYFNLQTVDDLNEYALQRYNKLLTTTEEDFAEDQKVSAEGPREDWSNLPGATPLKQSIKPNIFDEKAAASSQAVLDDEFSMADLEGAELPVGWIDDVLDERSSLGKRSRSYSFEPLEKQGGRKTRKKKRKTRKKKRKTRKKKRKTKKKKRKTRKKKRKTRKKKRR